MSTSHQEIPSSYRVLLVDDNEAIHGDYRSLLAFERNDELDELDELERLALGEPVEPTPKLELPSYRFDSVYQGQDALAAVSRSVAEGDPYAVAFVDLRMPPGWDGLTTIKRIWEVDANIQVVVCSAFSDFSWRDIVNELGATDRLLLLRKPFDASAVRQLALAMTRKWYLDRAYRQQVSSLEQTVAERTLELRTALEALEQRNAELSQATVQATEASRAKSRFLAHMSHELRTPLNGVLGAAQLLSSSELDRAQERLVALVSRSGQSLLTVINDVLDISRIEAGKLRLERGEFDVRQSIDEAISIVAVARKLEVELAARVAVEVPELLQGDPDRFRQIVLNLVGNALKFTFEGSVKVEVTYVAERSSIRTEIRDTGIGIDQDLSAQLFEPFVQVDEADTRKFGGMGLGLTICKNLVELMGGRIGVESVADAGSTFWFELPTQSGPRVLTQKPNEHVLVVGARTTNRDILSAYLEEVGLAVDVASSFGRAKKLAIERGVSRYMAIFVDSTLLSYEASAVFVERRLGDLARGSALCLVTEDAAEGSRAVGPGRFLDSMQLPIAYHAVSGFVQRMRSGEWMKRKGRQDPSRPSARSHVAQVLVADDNRINQKIIERMLDSIGCRVDVVSNGAEAVRAVGLKRYDLVLMDIQMPVTDGLEATRVIRERSPENEPRIPIVAITASVLEEERNRCLDLGMDDVLVKPMELSRLQKVVQRCMNGLPIRDGDGA